MKKRKKIKLKENHVSMIRTKTKEVNNKKTSKMITKRTMIVVKLEEEVGEEVVTIKMGNKELSKKKNTKRSQQDRYLMIQTTLRKKRKRMEKDKINKEEEVEVINR